MSNPEYKIVVKDISAKVINPREELMKDTKPRKPFIFKGYTSEADRIKDIEYNNKLLYNLPDYPDIRSQKITREKSENRLVDRYNFNIDIPKKFNTINSNDKINIDKEMKKNEELNSNINSIKNNNSSNSYGYKNLRKLSVTEKKMYNDLIKKNLIYQPQMRFRARTDLERVFDLLNYKSLTEKDRQIIEKQLTNIDLYKFKKPRELLNLQKNKSKEENQNKIEDKKYIILPNPIIEEQKREKEKLKNEKLLYNKNKLYYEFKNNDKKLWARKDNLNQEARKFLSSYHYKTHFKATEEAQFNFNKKSESVDNKINNCLMIPNLFTESNELPVKKKNKLGHLKIHNIKSRMNYNYSELDKIKDIFNFGDDLLKDEEEETIKVDDYNDITKRYQNNPMFDSKKIKPNPEFMRNLSEMAFKKTENKGEEKSEEYDDKSININDRYNLDNQDKTSYLVNDENIHDTAKLILGECKLYNSKSKFNNSFLKSRTGKTMITKGLSINDFLKKYCLSE